MHFKSNTNPTHVYMQVPSQGCLQSCTDQHSQPGHHSTSDIHLRPAHHPEQCKCKPRHTLKQVKTVCQQLCWWCLQAHARPGKAAVCTGFGLEITCMHLFSQPCSSLLSVSGLSSAATIVEHFWTSCSAVAAATAVLQEEFL